MPLSIIRTTDATEEPLSLNEAKDHLRVSNTNSDTLITSLIKSARNLIEKWTHRQILTATWVMALDYFPWQFGSNARFGAPVLQTQGGPLMASWSLPGFGNMFDVFEQQIIRLPRPPLQSVTSIAYIDSNGDPQTLDPSLYIVDAISEPARISPSYGESWPTAQVQINAITITFVAGWTPANMTEDIKHLTRLLVGHFFENRIPVLEAKMNEMPLAIQTLVSALEWGDYQ